MKTNYRALLVTVSTVLVLCIGCSNPLITPTKKTESKNRPGTIHAFAPMVIKISGIGTDHLSSSARTLHSFIAPDKVPAQAALTAYTDSIQMKSTGQPNQVDFNGTRYVYTNYEVRNNTGEDLQNLTFIAASSNQTLGHTAIWKLQENDGTFFVDAFGQATADNIAETIKPSGKVTVIGAQLKSILADVIQIFTENKVQAVQNTLPAGNIITDLFPYGFVTENQNNSNSRRLPASPPANVYDGFVHFSVKLPIPANIPELPRTIWFLVLPVTDSKTRITQSVEEQQPLLGDPLTTKITALNPDFVNLLPGSNYTYSGSATPTVRYICDEVRIAGTVSNPPTTTLFTSTQVSTCKSSHPGYIPQP